MSTRQEITVRINPNGFKVGSAKSNSKRSSGDIPITAEVTAGGPGGEGCHRLVGGVLAGSLPKNVEIQSKDDEQENVILGLIGAGR